MEFDLNQEPQDGDDDFNEPPPPPSINFSPITVDLNQEPQDGDDDFNEPPPPPSINFSPITVDLNQHAEEDSFPPTNVQEHNKRKNLTFDQKRSIIEMLLNETIQENLPRGVLSKVADHFSVGKRSVERLWRSTKIGLQNGAAANVSSNMVHRVGRKRVEIDLEMMQSIPYRRRTNIRSTANALGMSKTTVHRRIKDGSIRAHSNAMKPDLLPKTKIARLEHCLSMVDESVSPAIFFGMYNHIHIDEKWFYMSTVSQKYYSHPREAEPVRRVTSKRFIPEVMFLSALARPRLDENGDVEFDGKIGIWAFAFTEPAKRRSKNRAAGTLEMRAMKSVTQKVTREFFIDKLLPAIIQKWPCDGSTIYIQQDNAKPHISIHDKEFCEAVQQSGLDVRICFQPPNSPDLNVNDLGFFRSIDQYQHQEAPSTVAELVSGVEKAFLNYPSYKINKVFLTLQLCMAEILKKKGDNDYSIPHANKDRLIIMGEFPTCFECDSEVLNAAKEALELLRQQENGTLEQ